MKKDDFIELFIKISRRRLKRDLPDEATEWEMVDIAYKHLIDQFSHILEIENIQKGD